MHSRTAALACAAVLASTTLAHAQSAPTAPTVPTVPPTEPKTTMEMQWSAMIPVREVAAIGTGIVVGAALGHVIIGHGFMVVGAVVGGWIGDWWYGAHPMPSHAGG
jgi:uncharacterized protein YcfJ